MRVTVEITEDQVIEYLKECIETCMSVSWPHRFDLEHKRYDLVEAVKTCEAINEAIDYLGGERVELSKVEPYVDGGV